MDNFKGTIRVGNRRKGSPHFPRGGDSIVLCDRSNPVLGNPHVLSDANDAAERERVIDLYANDLAHDLKTGGPKAVEIRRIARRVLEGEHVVCLCWCAPKPCHADLIVSEVLKEVSKVAPDHPALRQRQVQGELGL